MTRSYIIQRVLIKLDEISEQEESFDSLRSLADNLLDESANDLLMLLPFHWLPLTGMQIVQEDQEEVGQYGYIKLPADFLRLGKLKLNEWGKPVFYAYPEGHPVAEKQSYTNLRGGTAKPVAVISKSNAGKRLYYYSVINNHDVEELDYVKVHEGDEMPDNLIDPLTWMCAAKVLQAMGEPKGQEAATTQVNNWIKTHQ